ncbi:hypothetical protein KPH14_011312 [Odynerus spinipes]|uniref:VWFA domain-containing protein n=1 Tax=Odynerus spinipes TaxID=1348599 RepID=A0AAD9R9C4_9HYME|nr:hypothetical protein KPH14_011312 [Odynerus spinipes]
MDWRFAVCVLLVVAGSSCLANDADIVDRWAQNLGTELWDLANAVARPEELLAIYRSMNTRVQDKSGDELVSIISENVGRMLRRKMDAVTCIRIAAEANAEIWEEEDEGNFTYYSGKYSPIGDKEEPTIPQNMKKNKKVYRQMELSPDSHFYNIPVNTNHSSVHIPTNVYDLSRAVVEDIKKTETLDETFRQNYESDPALSWQYFGSVTGMLRQYPSMQWRTDDPETDDEGVDLYDCRVRSWFIEAATCSKDMVILMDTSGSMTGMGLTIARATVVSILDTLSNNDFVTLLSYNNQTEDMVPCFKDMLIQATPENIDTFKKSMDEIKTEGVANLTEAFTRAFSLLKTYRETRGCDAETPCNQLIMLVTDGVPGNLSENPALATWLWKVMEHEKQKSRLEKYLKGKRLGVRINEDAIYIKKLHKDEDVRVDPASLNTTAWQEYRLLTSVSTPVFDRKGNRNNRTRIANLLGVAGTDVPIDDIRKLTLPYKLGVNGYAFIVSNNGYVILHPDLRPVHKGRLKLNYNSVDLTEVEILDDGRVPRNPGPEILALRAALVDHKRGNMRDVPVKLHWDDNRRVTLERRDYFYAPLPGTPFGLAVALPNYGTTWIKVGDEILRNQQRKVNVSDFFAGNYWRVHPGWVYCRFHYLEGHEFRTPEDELRYFLARLDQPGWRWSDQYEAYPIAENETLEEDPECGRQTLHHDDYYCNKELMQLLVFDARATNNSFAGDYLIDDPVVRELAENYGIYLRFIATQSGLTRWHHLVTNDLPDEDDGIEFGDLHRRAVNEPWYKGAIFQNNLDPYSISISVPWEAGADAIVTASMGIFPRDGGKKAPAAVTGFQMPMTGLYKKFIQITSNGNSSMSCTNIWIDCYLVDQNGYIVISEGYNDTGQFMGTQEGAVMNSMVEQGLFNAVEIYDYQAWCEEECVEGAAYIPTNPLTYLSKLLLWFLLRVTCFTTQFVNLPLTFGKVHPDEDAPDPPPPPRPYLYHYPCDQKRTLYMLNQTVAAKGVKNNPEHCSRPYYAQRVPHTNLLLVVIDSMFPTCYDRLQVTPVTISPFEYTNGMEDRPCHKIPLNDLKRRRLEGCFTEHPLEHEIEACGRGSRQNISFLLLSIVVLKIICKFI